MNNYEEKEEEGKKGRFNYVGIAIFCFNVLMACWNAHLAVTGNWLHVGAALISITGYSAMTRQFIKNRKSAALAETEKPKIPSALQPYQWIESESRCAGNGRRKLK